MTKISELYSLGFVVYPDVTKHIIQVQVEFKFKTV